MRLNNSFSSTTVGLISLIFLYSLLIVLILVLSNQILTDISMARPFSNSIIITLLIVVTLALVILIVSNVIKLFRERKREKSGARFKLRLLMFFSLIALFSAIPQGILSVSFINIAMDSWFSSKLGDALRGGLHIAIEYHHDKIENLEKFNNSYLYGYMLDSVDKNPDGIWDHIQSMNPEIQGLQIYDESGFELVLKGDERSYIEFRNVRGRKEGLLPKESAGDVSILRVLKRFSKENSEYFIVLSIILPEQFDFEAQNLTTSLESFNQLDHMQSLFRIAIIIFFILFSIPMLFLSLLVSFLLSGEIIRPIANLEDATKRVAEGDYSFRILTKSKDELSLLVNSFNSMVSELDRSRTKILQTEKVTAWQEIAQRLAHEIKNPLTPIRLSAERILKKFFNKPEDMGKMIEPAIDVIIKEVDNLNNLLKEFRDFASLPEPKPEALVIKDLIRDCSLLYSNSVAEIEIDCSDIPDDIVLNVDKNQMTQVFTNLLKNAVEAMDQAGEIFIRGDIIRKGNKNFCRLQIQDTGTGIDEEEHDKVFHPYFTTKSQGTGLGLSIVERIIFDHNGQIWFESQKDVGTTFFIDLPME